VIVKNRNAIHKLYFDFASDKRSTFEDTVPHQSSDYDVVSQDTAISKMSKDYRARIWNADFTYIGRQGYGGEYTRPLYLVALQCKVFPTKHHSVFQRLIHQQLSKKNYGGRTI
jgi:hypothetical protein